MVVTYDPAVTEGLTVDDVIEAISALYGTATKPADSIAISNSTTHEDQQKVLARWEDAQSGRIKSSAQGPPTFQRP